MPQSEAACGHYNFVAVPKPVTQGCLTCNRVFRTGGAVIYVEHAGKSYMLGSFEEIVCPYCGEDKTEKSPVLFENEHEAVAFCQGIATRFEQRDPTLTLNLMGYKCIQAAPETPQ